MPHNTVRLSRSDRRQRNRNQRGIALLTTLLLLLLMTGLSLAMVMSARSDMMINGYYRNFRGSFYAADSGLNIARQDLMNQLAADASSTFSGTSQPIANGTDTTVQTYINNTYGSYHSITGSGSASSSWPEKYKITSATFGLAQCTVLGGTGTCSAPSGAVTGYQYIYNYSLTAVGQSNGNEAATLSDRGSVIVNALLTAASTTTSFAGWGMFIDNSPICNGTTLVPGTITGPVFTNGAWNFGTSGSYIFTDSVGSHNADAGFQFKSSCDTQDAASDKSGSTTIAPTFQSGFKRNQPSVPLPANDFNQKRAVLDGMGSSSSPVTKQDLNNNVRSVTGAPYPNSGASSGVFLPYSVDSNGKNPTFTGGGIYVEGDAKVSLTPSGANGQTYTITQGSGSSAVTTTITVTPGSTPGSGTTVISSGSNTLTISGVPAVQDPATNAITGDGTMLYVNGNITGLSGPGQGQAAVNDGSALTITAANNITITGDILYKSEPVTLTQTTDSNGKSIPADSPIPANDHKQALGIFTASGDIQLNNGQSNNNLEIDASMATISQNGSGGLTNIGNQIDTLAIVGGRIQNNIKNINTTTRNVFFDRRFGGSFAPPFFPSTSVSAGSLSPNPPVITVQRVQWLNQTSYF